MSIRLILTTACLTAFAAFAPAGIVPPIPRVPASALEPASPDAKADANDPAKIADRIAENTKLAGDRLKENDASEPTRKTQEQILKDIDALLKQAENPPPMNGGGGGSNNNSNNNDPSSSPNNKGGTSGNSQSNPGGSSGQKNQPGGKPQSKLMGGGSGEKPQRGSWRDRRQSGNPERQPGGDPMAKGEPQPMGPGSKEPMGVGGTPMKPMGNGTQAGGMGGTSLPPGLPLDDAITKQVWGHLPERLRQQMSQYYREQFVSKYGDLLRDYYSSLAEREKATRK